MAFVVLLIVSVAALAVLYRSSSDNAETARDNAKTAEQRLVQSYVEQGRHALLDGKNAEALVYLTEVIHRGGDAPDVRFMLDRAAQPLAMETLRLRSSTPRMWTATFSCDGTRILASDENGAQISDAQSCRLLFSLPNSAPVQQADYGPDCAIVVTFGRDGVVKIWNADTGQLARVLTSPSGVNRPAFSTGAVSPDGAMIAGLDHSQGSVCVWDIRTGAVLAQLAHASEPRSKVAFSHDGHWLASYVGGDLRVFDTRTWKPQPTPVTSNVTNFDFDPTGDRILIGTSLGDLSIWTIPGWRRVRHLREVGESVGQVVFSPDGQLVAAASGEGTAFIWQASSGQLQARLANQGRRLLGLQFDRRSKLVVSTSEGGVFVTDVVTGMPLSVLAAARYVTSLHFDPSSERVVGSSLDGTARVWNASPLYRRWISSAIGKDCGTSVSPQSDRRIVALGCEQHDTEVWDTGTGQRIATLPRVDRLNAPGLPALSSTGDLVAMARGSTVEVYELPGGRLIKTIHHGAPITAVRFASRGHGLVAGASDGTLLVVRDGDAEPQRASLGASAIDVAALLPDGRVIAVDAERRMTIFDVERQVRVAELQSPSRVEAIRVSSDGQRVITIPQVTVAQPPVLWMVEPARMVAKLDGHGGQAYSARFVRDEHEVLTAGTDGTARLWDAATGQLRQTYFAVPALLVDAVLSPDGSFVVAGDADGMLRFWDASSGSALWMLRAHKSMISGIHFEGDALISRGVFGELARWELPKPSAVGSSIERYDRLVACGPLRFDPVAGGLVTQSPACEGPSL